MYRIQDRHCVHGRFTAQALEWPVTLSGTGRFHMQRDFLPGNAAPTVDCPMTQEPLVRFQGVQKTYDGEHLVVRHLDLDIHRGEFLSLLGPSGSGKTTA